ncbi:hypothetical protein ABIB75_005195 [Bradyrhizobium sp. GM2.2]|uniref:hypothetical protein n=1 Tax=Bradyrhizobium TaxID=374 RepID=UPI001177A371|nr:MULTISPECIES: hypothetical protein [Bradyrhizobium]MCK1291255.1 hypothetical protein [Bradyrhizobium sp. 30]MCK1318308.1 hypothetical protein [Bradyrhizobium sp. 23]MCK1348776.1 hypothetical protein [Bradyrhizobium sp. CW11]MCK1470739.1 hypothetical protein [Bradyrhizobium sp. CW10]MCK1482202.1 hypothetical protein [Bradyrhizobium sp. 193]
MAKLSQALGLDQTAFRFAGRIDQSTDRHLAKAVDQIGPIEDCATTMVASIGAMADPDRSGLAQKTWSTRADRTASHTARLT